MIDLSRTYLVRLFITNQYLAFSGWPETRVLISLCDIENVEKKQMFFIPNALTVRDSDGEEYFFGSFLDRDLCFRMLTSMVAIAKSLGEIAGETSESKKAQRKNSLTRINQFNQEIEGNPENLIENSEPNEMDVEDSCEGEGEDLGDGDESEYDLSKLPDYLSLFETNSVSSVYNTSITLACSLVWRICWQEKLHFT